MTTLSAMIQSAHATNFQKLVWLELLHIPYGTVVSYSDIAKRIGHPKAVRAVGTAIGKNPFAPAVPCHRVIRSDGKIGAYSGVGGIEGKRKLLQQEGLKI